MKSRIERYEKNGWITVAHFESAREGIRLLPAIGRILNAIVRLRDDGIYPPDIGTEIIPINVYGDSASQSFVFEPEPK